MRSDWAAPSFSLDDDRRRSRSRADFWNPTGLVRADQVIGVDVHQTPALTGKPAHWLLDIVLPASTGNGTRGDWTVTALHRTLV